MKLKEFFPTEEQVDRAKRTVDRLSNKKEKSKKDDTAFVGAKAVVKRHQQVRTSIAAVGVAIGVGLMGYGIVGAASDESTSTSNGNEVSLVPEGKTSDHKKENGQLSEIDKIKQVDHLINVAEQGVDNLEQTVRKKVELMEDFDQRKVLMEAFKLAALNKDNPNKNYERLMSELEGTTLRQQNINYFSYGVDSKNSGFSAAYIPPQRVVKLDAGFDKDNLLDGLILYHELQHVMHDTVTRSKLNTKEKFDDYNNFFRGSKGDKMRMSVLGEGTAYGVEIELLNVILDGRLKNGEAVNIEEVRKLLKARKDQIGTVALLLEFANAYYGSKSSIKGLRRSYLQKIANKYDPQKYEVMWQTPYL